MSLLSFSPSPWRDDGCDISDYTGVHPAYGTLRDFQSFLREAHNRALRVIAGIVVNHASDRHRWFQRACRSPPGSKYRDFYVWSDSPEKHRKPASSSRISRRPNGLGIPSPRRTTGAASYAALSGLVRELLRGPRRIGALEQWAAFWSSWACDLFLEGYSPVARESGLLPPSAEDTRTLIGIYALERALAETANDRKRLTNPY